MKHEHVRCKPVGDGYFSCTAVAKSNIPVNKPNETKWFYEDHDRNGARLNSRHNYSGTFANAQLPPVCGFWFLSMESEQVMKRLGKTGVTTWIDTTTKVLMENLAGKTSGGSGLPGTRGKGIGHDDALRQDREETLMTYRSITDRR